ncbi:MAG: hypothetical protein U1F34_03390, partial [Gammaproteobacteria bacterium]
MQPLHAYLASLQTQDYILLVLCLLLLAVLWLLWRPRLSAAEREQLIRLDTRLEDQSRRMETLDTRFDDLITEQLRGTGELKSDVIERFERLRNNVAESLADGRTQSVRSLMDLREELRTHLSEHRTRFEQRQLETSQGLQEGLGTAMTNVQQQVGAALLRYAEELGKRVEALTLSTDKRLQEI